MASLWKRATPSQYRILRAVAGAVLNAAHAHRVDMPKTFARSVAKRATGTLTAQWPDVLAATTDHRRHKGLREKTFSRDPRGSYLLEGRSEGDRLGLLRRSPIRAAWKRFAADMWRVKREGTPEQFAARVRILKLLDQAQIEYAGMLDAVGSPGTTND